MAWQKNGTPDTLTGADPDVEITDLSSLKFNVFLAHIFPDPTADQNLTVNGSSASVYAQRNSTDGASDGTSTSNAFVNMRFFNDEDHFHYGNHIWISGEEKLFIMWTVTPDATGASTAPHRYEWAVKYVPSPDEDLTEIKFNKGSFTNFATNSNLSALGTN